MNQYSESLKAEAKKLRMQGKTYYEINNIFKTSIPKSTLRTWFKDTPLPIDYHEKIIEFNKSHLKNARVRAVEANKAKRTLFLRELDFNNAKISKNILKLNFAKIGLAMLCLGEASKSTSSSPFYLGNSNPKIIKIFLELLRVIYKIDNRKFRCTVQCRADQDQDQLEKYWQEVTKIPANQFYKSRIDSRTVGKPTLRSGYMGVLKVDYLDSKVQLDLESLADMIYNSLVE